MATAIESRIKSILYELKNKYPDAHCSLNYSNAFELLVATILSAQCTDERVNKVTPDLFREYPSPEKMAQAPVKRIEALIRSTGFFKNKALSISSSSLQIVTKHRGQVPSDMESLTSLRGVGRKTANVILGNAFSVPGLVVDTHVKRLANRMGMTQQSDPVKIESQLMKLVAKKDWTQFGHWMIQHGRSICNARKPQCDQCFIAEICPKVGVKIRGLLIK